MWNGIYNPFERIKVRSVRLKIKKLLSNFFFPSHSRTWVFCFVYCFFSTTTTVVIMAGNSQRIVYGGIKQAGVQRAVEAGHINIGMVRERETLELDDKTLQAQHEHAEKLRALEVQSLATRIAVPTDDQEVKEKLISLGEPIIMYGEDKADRRLRLQKVMAKAQLRENPDAEIRDGLADAIAGNLQRRDGDVDMDGQGAAATTRRKETFYYPAPKYLVKARKSIAAFSFERADERRRRNREHVENGDKTNRTAIALVKNARKMRVAASQIGGTRPVSACSLTAGGKALVTSSWDGLCSVWDTETYNRHCKMKGHTERVVDVATCPNASDGADTLSFASSSVDGTAILWPRGPRADFAGGEAMDVDDGDEPDAALPHTAVRRRKKDVTYVKPLAVLSGHKDRLGRLGGHPSGRFLGTTSYDRTWRLWDVEVGKELLLQEGHAREVYGIAFHPDGSLVCTTSLSSNGRLWDLRSGKSIMSLCGHAKPALTVDFSPNGFVVATGSMDNTVRIWDLRKMKTVYTIPAHTHLVSCVKFAPVSGEYLVTAGYDCMVNVWSGRNYHLLKRLQGHEKHVMKVDISKREDAFYTAGFDRTWKLWCAPETSL